MAVENATVGPAIKLGPPPPINTGGLGANPAEEAIAQALLNGIGGGEFPGLNGQFTPNSQSPFGNSLSISRKFAEATILSTVDNQNALLASTAEVNFQKTPEIERPTEAGMSVALEKPELTAPVIYEDVSSSGGTESDLL